MIYIRSVNKNDNNAKLIMDWRNDSITQRNSLNQSIKTWNSFKDEFYNNYFKNIPLFAIYNNQKIAFVSFLYTNKDYILNIGINLDPNYRGKGLSTLIINESVNYIKNNYPNIKYIIAEIKESNVPSIKTFTRANFIYQNSYCLNNENINVYLYSI